jgi:uncharacterized membrane protein
MKDQATLLEGLLENATDYGKTSFELIKLKAVDKSSDVVSSLVPQSVVLVVFMSFMLFLNLGFAFWIGEVMGKIFYGFFVMAAIYCVIGLFFYVFMRKWLKELVCNYIIKQVLK